MNIAAPESMIYASNSHEQRLILMNLEARQLVPLLLTLSFIPCANELIAAEPTPQEVFDRRIMAIFKSPNPSSCVQCHLAGVDLKNYILPSHEKTFLSLRDQGLIDMERPEQSKILKLIAMKEGDKKGADLIHEKTRAAELEAFTAWIKASCADPKLRAEPKLKPEERAEAARPVEVIRHARKDRLLDSFENTIWAMRFRCMNCHTQGTPENEKLRKEHGERVTWVKADSAATMDYLIASKLIDTKEPEKSLLLLKPLGEVKHGGGKKFLPGDLGHKAFRTWIEDYVRIKRDDYADKDALPKTSNTTERFGTDIWLKLQDTPPEWADRLLMVELFAWDEAKKAWESEPVATSDRGVWGGGKLWQHSLTLLADRKSERAKNWKSGKPSLLSGRYLVKVYVDAEGRSAKDWKAALGEGDGVGQVEITSRWPAGYGAMTVVEASKVRK
jgi:hypothetical protein